MSRMKLQIFSSSWNQKLVAFNSFMPIYSGNPNHTIFNLGKTLLLFIRNCVLPPKVWETDMTFDLDLWPTDLNINRDHLLIKDYLPTKFGASGAKCSWVISCTRLRDTDIPTDTCNAICPSFLEGGHKYVIALYQGCTFCIINSYLL